MIPGVELHAPLKSTLVWEPLDSAALSTSVRFGSSARRTAPVMRHAQQSCRLKKVAEVMRKAAPRSTSHHRSTGLGWVTECAKVHVSPSTPKLGWKKSRSWMYPHHIKEGALPTKTFVMVAGLLSATFTPPDITTSSPKLSVVVVTVMRM